MIHFIIRHQWEFIIGAGLITAFIIALGFAHTQIIRSIRRAFHFAFPATIPSWKIIMSTSRPGSGRPRYFTLHTLAALTGRNDLLKIAKEMKRSCEVNAIYCQDVKAPVFFLHSVWHKNEKSVWKMLKKFIDDNPYPEIKGFQRAVGSWSGGEYGKGTYTPARHASPEPFIKDDYAYANKIIFALHAAPEWSLMRGYHKRNVGIKEYKIDKD